MWWSLRRLALLVFLLLFMSVAAEGLKCRRLKVPGNVTNYNLAEFAEQSADMYDEDYDDCGDNSKYCIAGVYQVKDDVNEFKWVQGCTKELPSGAGPVIDKLAGPELHRHAKTVVYACKEVDCHQKFFEAVAEDSKKLFEVLDTKEFVLPTECSSKNLALTQNDKKWDMREVGISKLSSTKFCPDHCITTICEKANSSEVVWLEGCSSDSVKACGLGETYDFTINQCMYGKKDDVMISRSCKKPHCRTAFFYCMEENGSSEGAFNKKYPKPNQLAPTDGFYAECSQDIPEVVNGTDTDGNMALPISFVSSHVLGIGFLGYFFAFF